MSSNVICVGGEVVVAGFGDMEMIKDPVASTGGGWTDERGGPKAGTGHFSKGVKDRVTRHPYGR